jgi:hypothetical protein
MPNPEGVDSGQEWIEIYNPGPETFDLSAWFLDHGNTNGDALGSQAYQFPTGTFLEAGSYKQLLIPQGKFQFKNTAQDAVRLFAPDQTVKFIQFFIDIPEGLTYAKNEQGVWENLLPSPNRQNSNSDRPVDEDERKISTVSVSTANDTLDEDIEKLLFKDSELLEDGLLEEGNIANEESEIEVPAVPAVAAAKTTAKKTAVKSTAKATEAGANSDEELEVIDQSVTDLESTLADQVTLLAEKIETLSDLTLSRAQAAESVSTVPENGPKAESGLFSGISYIVMTGLMLAGVWSGYVVGKNKSLIVPENESVDIVGTK